MGQSGVRQWRLLATALSLALGAVVLHFLLYVGPREGAIDRRNERALAAVAKLVSAEIGHVVDIVKNTTSERREASCDGQPSPPATTGGASFGPQPVLDAAELRSRLQLALESSDALGLDVQSDPSLPCKGEPPAVALRYAPGADPEQLQVLYRFCPTGASSGGGLRVSASIELDALLPQRSDGSDRLDQLLIIDAQRHVLYQDAVAGPRTAELPKVGAAQKSSAAAFFTLGADRPSLAIGGQSYYAYEQPIANVYPPDGSDQAPPRSAGAASATSGAALQLTAVGLVEVDHFAKERFALPITLTLGVVCLLLFVLLSWPFLKLILMGARERLRAVDGQLLFFGIIACAGLATILCQDFVYLKQEHKRRVARLQHLAESVDASLESELRAAHGLLSAFATAISKPGTQLERTQVSASDPQLAGPAREPYNAFQTLYRVNECGMQDAKWSSSERLSPLISVADRPYVTDTRSGRFMAHYAADDTRPKAVFNVDPVRSHSSAQKLTILSIPLAGTQETVHLSTELGSLTEPLLPPGYGFAVVDRAGHVMYHADSRKSLEESFFDETDGDRQLKSAVQNGMTGELEVEYAGDPTLLYVQPLHGLRPWTLIAYESDELHETVNLEIAASSLACFGLYVLLLVFLRFAVFLGTGSPHSEWMWPEVHGCGSFTQRRGDGPCACNGEPDDVLGRLVRAFGAARVTTPEERSAAHVRCAVLLFGQLLSFVLMLRFGGALGVFWSSLAMPLLALATSYLVLEPSSRMWATRAIARAVAAVALIVLLYAYLCPSLPAGNPWLTLTVIAIAASCALLARAIGKQAGKRPQLLPGSRVSRGAYVAGGLLLVGILGGGPAWAMFDDAARVEHAARVQLMQRQFIGNLEDHAAGLDRRNRAGRGLEARKTYVDSHLPMFAQPDEAQRRERYLPRWSGAYPLFDVTIGVAPPAADARVVDAECNWFSARHFTCPIWRHMPRYNALTSELRAASAPTYGRFLLEKLSPSRAAEQCYRAEANLGVLGLQPVRVTQPQSNPLELSYLESWDAFVLVIALLSAFLGVVRVTALRLFGLTVASFPRPRDRASAEAVAAGTSCIHFAPSNAERAALARGCTVVDLRELDAAAKIEGGGALLVEQLDSCYGSAERTARALASIERWVHVERRIVHLVVLVDPLSFLGEWRSDGQLAGVKDAELPDVDRWAGLLAGFDRMHYEHPEYTVPESKARKGALCLIAQECGWDEGLHAVGRRIEQRALLTDLSDDELLLLIANHSGPRHRQLWSLCTRAEQLLLVRLGQEGYVNPRAWPVARRLERRGLLRRDPAYRIVSESLRLFIGQAMQPAEIERIESLERSTWMRLSLPLLIITSALAAFVLWSQPAFTNTLFAVVGAGAAGFAGVLRLVVAVRQGRAQLDEFRR